MAKKSKIDRAQLHAAFTNESGKVSEEKIARRLIEQYQLSSLHGLLYDMNGLVDLMILERVTAELLANLGVDSGVAKKAKEIIRLSVQLSAVEDMPVDRSVIPVNNGTIHVNDDGSYRFSPIKQRAPYRLTCRFDPEASDLSWFKRWLCDVLWDDDHACLQEIMGYMLLPITCAQRSFFLIGEGGSGKSVWGCVLKKMFGNSMTCAETHMIETNRFIPATLENKLVNYDDDLDGAALTKSNRFKTIVTAKQPIMVERKGVDAFEFTPYARLCGCGNSSISSTGDLSDAFVRRLLLIKTKPPIDCSKVIPDIEERIYPETSALLNWCLVGLTRLIQNNYRFSESDRSKELVERVREDSNSIIPFINAEIDFGEYYCVSSENLVTAYRRFCRQMDYESRSPRLLIGYFKNNAEKYAIRYANKTPKYRSRGFVGMKLKSDQTQKKPAVDLDAIFREG